MAVDGGAPGCESLLYQRCLCLEIVVAELHDDDEGGPSITMCAGQGHDIGRNVGYAAPGKAFYYILLDLADLDTLPAYFVYAIVLSAHYLYTKPAVGQYMIACQIPGAIRPAWAELLNGQPGWVTYEALMRFGIVIEISYERMGSSSNNSRT